MLIQAVEITAIHKVRKEVFFIYLISPKHPFLDIGLLFFPPCPSIVGGLCPFLLERAFSSHPTIAFVVFPFYVYYSTVSIVE